jgi:hypothetical protein
MYDNVDKDELRTFLVDRPGWLEGFKELEYVEESFGW